MAQRVENGHRLHQMRAEPGEHQVALAQGLADQPEFELLEVAQAAVDQLAGTAAGAGGPVASFQQRGRQPARRRVERASGADHAAADDNDVEGLALQPFQGGDPGFGTEAHTAPWWLSYPPSAVMSSSRDQ